MGPAMKKRRSHSTSRPPGPPSGLPPARPAESSARKQGFRFAPFLAVAFLVGGAAVFLVAVVGDDTTDTAGREELSRDPAQDLAPDAHSGAKSFPYHDSPEEARPFPVTLPPNTYTHEALRTTYALAKEIPEVLVQLPCLCGCHSQAEDHGSLLDCYVDNHAAT